ncbi:MAG: hypothetical protein [Caudoviricetes sp.]|nr:MAG: hypothetical protein [Caudoviricetes sp.]QHJ82495.1 MAG: hypothetical protein [Caudoviricetes sp.]
MSNLFARLNLVDSKSLMIYNTGTLLDIATGTFVPGVDGSQLLYGGVSSMFGVGGRPKNFKSTILNSYLVNLLARYDDSTMIIYDVENSIVADKQRVLEMSTLYLDDPDKREEHLADLDERVRVIGLNQCPDLETFNENIIQPIVAEKRKIVKDLEKVTPIIDPKTNELKKAISPTIIVFDSWSQAEFSAVSMDVEKKGISDKGNSMAAARENLLKNQLIKTFPKLSSELGIYFAFTTQISDTIQTNMFAVQPKSMPFMKHNSTYRSVSKGFYYLISTQIGLSSPKTLGTKTESDYSLQDITAVNELFTVRNTIESIKGGNGSGGMFDVVVSQNQGYHGGLSNFIYLKEHDYFGLGTNKIHPKCALNPEVSLARKKAVAALMDYKTYRAIEITAQLCYVQNTWTLNNSKVQFDITPEKLYEELNKTSYKIDDILNTRGWWTWEDSKYRQERDYISLYDILRLLNK